MPGSVASFPSNVKNNCSHRKPIPYCVSGTVLLLLLWQTAASEEENGRNNSWDNAAGNRRLTVAFKQQSADPFISSKQLSKTIYTLLRQAQREAARHRKSASGKNLGSWHSLRSNVTWPECDCIRLGSACSVIIWEIPQSLGPRLLIHHAVDYKCGKMPPPLKILNGFR